MDVVIILMATYNGEAFIEKQINSLICQSYTNWRMIIRDDGSTDGTKNIIMNYLNIDSRISFIENETDVKGACENFSSLLAYIKTDGSFKYAMFCDQDDIWKKDKIEQSVNEIKKQEKAYPGQPILIYSDLESMDEMDNLIEGSFKLKHKLSLRNLISFNYAYGCTMIFNRPLIIEVGEIPALAENHDYWMGLVASIYKSSFLNQKLLRYRRHNSNVSGNVVGNNNLIARLKRHVIAPKGEVRTLQKRLVMLSGFYKSYQSLLTSDNKKMLYMYLKAFEKGRLKVCYIMLTKRIFRRGFFQTLSSFYQIIFFYNKIKNFASVN